MTKNLLKKLSALAFVAVLATTGAVGISYAKYVRNEAKASETAHVAGFGVTMVWAGDAFASTYATNNAAVSGEITNSVVAAADRVAPGTTGSITLTLSGSSEVAFTFALSLTEVYSDNWKVSAEGAEYKPIALTATKKVGTGEVESVTLTNGAIPAENYAPGTITETVYTFTWTWAFEGGNDAADTYMSGVADATYSLAGSATATQID